VALVRDVGVAPVRRVEPEPGGGREEEDSEADGVGPEALWGEDVALNEDSDESGDIFEVAMENNFKVGSRIIEAICDGSI